MRDMDSGEILVSLDHLNDTLTKVLGLLERQEFRAARQDATDFAENLDGMIGRQVSFSRSGKLPVSGTLAKIDIVYGVLSRWVVRLTLESGFALFVDPFYCTDGGETEKTDYMICSECWEDPTSDPRPLAFRIYIEKESK